MLKKIIIASLIIWLTYASGKLLIMYYRVYHSHKEAKIQLNKQLAEQERLSKLTVQEILKEIPPQYGVKSELAEKIVYCESSYNKNAIHYNDGGKGKHSVGAWQFQKATFDLYAKKMGQELDYYSPLDQTKVASYMIAHGQLHQWSCSRII